MNRDFNTELDKLVADCYNDETQAQELMEEFVCEWEHLLYSELGIPTQEQEQDGGVSMLWEYIASEIDKIEKESE